MTTLFADAISSRIPHRYENLLLDESTPLPNGASEFNLTIPTNDALGRDLFHYDIDGRTTLPTPILAEIAALACIVSSGAIKPGTFAYFAAITNFSLTGHAFSGTDTINGTTQKVSDKNGFHKYSFQLSNASSEAKGEIMAYYDTSNDASSAGPQPTVAIPAHIEAGLTIPGNKVVPFSNKHADMTFIDALALSSDSDALYRYTYPKNHPLIKGHFPENPVMMGVCQWQMVEDALTHYVQAEQLQEGTYTCNATIFKDDQTAVCDLKKLVFTVIHTSTTPLVITSAIKKVMFKQRVLPNDTLFCYLSTIASNQ